MLERRVDRSNRWSEPVEFTDKLCTLSSTVSSADIREVLGGVFGQNEVRRYESSTAFSGLLSWVAGDLRYPIAAVLMRHGLARGRVVHVPKEIAEILKRDLTTINRILGKTSAVQSHAVWLRDAHRRVAAAPPRVALWNQLRAAGLRSSVWTVLASRNILTIDDLCDTPRQKLLTIKGFSSKSMAEVEAALRDCDRKLK